LQDAEVCSADGPKILKLQQFLIPKTYIFLATISHQNDLSLFSKKKTFHITSANFNFIHETLQNVCVDLNFGG
jgi:hypothetical protein